MTGLPDPSLVGERVERSPQLAKIANISALGLAMRYRFLGLAVAVGLVAVFVLPAEALLWCKAVVLGVFLLSFLWSFGF